MAELPKIASLWIGGDLSWLEQLCLKSFADAGHQITLYSYSPISNLPDGVLAGDASEIYPGEPMLRHAITGSPAIHADLWRLNMLQKTDQIWVDCDVYCRRPFDFDSDFVFGWEKPGLVCNAVLGLPKTSKTLTLLLDFFKDPYAIGPWLKPHQLAELEAERDAGRPVHMSEQEWGFTGPGAVSWALKESGEIEHAQSKDTFFPLTFKERNHLILSRFDIEEEITDETRGIHLWARRLKPRLRDGEENKPRRGSFLDKMLKHHGIDRKAAPIPAKVSKFAGGAEDPRFRAMLAIEALRGDESVSQLAKNNNVDPADIRAWRTYLVQKAVKLFQ